MPKSRDVKVSLDGEDFTDCLKDVQVTNQIDTGLFGLGCRRTEAKIVFREYLSLENLRKPVNNSLSHTPPQFIVKVDIGGTVLECEMVLQSLLQDFEVRTTELKLVGVSPEMTVCDVVDTCLLTDFVPAPIEYPVEEGIEEIDLEVELGVGGIR